MAHFAKIEDGEVMEVLVIGNNHILDADGNESEASGQAFIADMGFQGEWKQTSYNTFAGVHKLGGTPLRKNYCGPGWSYDEGRDAFIPPKPFPSWILNEEACNWVSPVPMPEIERDENGLMKFHLHWNEETQAWDKKEIILT